MFACRVPGSHERISLPLEVCVHDNGPGIPEDIRPHIFDPFVTSKPGGKGLGLASRAKIVRDHGGSWNVRAGSVNDIQGPAAMMRERTQDLRTDTHEDRT